MLQATTIQFITNLATNNNKPWFDANRKHYEAAKADFNAFIQQIINGLAQQEPALSTLQVKDCTFRINRDVRFSANKDPYKTNMGAGFSLGGKKLTTAGYYLHIQPGASFVAGGLYMPEGNQLAQIRQEVDYNFAAFQAIVSAKAFTKTYKTLQVENGMQLVRPPKGYEASNPAIHYLRLKSFVATIAIPNEQLSSKTLVAKVLQHFATAQPLVSFLNTAIAV